jgi:hypothetical protein
MCFFIIRCHILALAIAPHTELSASKVESVPSWAKNPADAFEPERWRTPRADSLSFSQGVELTKHYAQEDLISSLGKRNAIECWAAGNGP